MRVNYFPGAAASGMIEELTESPPTLKGGDLQYLDMEGHAGL